MRLNSSFYKKFGLALELSVFVVKLAAFLMVSGAALYAETIHSLADVVDSLFIYMGLRLSRKPPDPEHPFGYGKETFFWALLTALFMISVSATLSVTKGISQFIDPKPLQHVGFGVWSLWVGLALTLVTLVMGLAIIFNGREVSLSGFTSYQDPSVKVKVVEDVAAAAGNLLALTALYIYNATGSLFLDALSAILVGAIIAFLGYIMAVESKDLLIGRSAPRHHRKMIAKAVMSVREVVRIMEMKTMLMGPDEILVNIEVNLTNGLDTDTVERVIDEIRARILQEVPQAKHIQVEAESA